METNLLDILWIIVAACLVFIMQAGFAMVESGLTRSKNSINVSIKNLTDLGVSTIFFWLIGFGIMFGTTKLGFFGTSHYLFKSTNTWIAVFFLFQAMFCSTSATIVSGAIAERVKYGAYIVATIFLSAIIYPVFGHWAWGGILEGSPTGWLGNLGFIDFAGSTVVHSLGGWVALAFLLIIGARKGRYGKNGEAQKISGSNIPMVVLGVLILWFGWFGFNGGSTLSMNESVAGIILKTTLSASAGMIATLGIGWPILKKPDVGLVMNGALAGLVAITAPVHAVNELQSIIIGSIGGLVMFFSSLLLDKLKIDDAVGAIPVHLFAGIWGTLAVGIFGDLELLGTDLSRSSQIMVQGLGIFTCGAWAFGISIIFLGIFNKFYHLRIDVQDEIDGLNKSEHGASTEIFDLYTVLHHQASTGDITLRAPVEPFTEVGQIANMYNEVLDKLEENTVEKDDYLNILENVSDGMFLLSRDCIVGNYYSKSLELILEKNLLAGRNFNKIIETIFMDSEKNLLKDFVDVAFDPEIRWRHVERLNPLKEVNAYFDNNQGGFRVKHLEFDFKRVEKDGFIKDLLVLVRDVTEEYELSEEVEKSRKKSHVEMELLYRILHVEPTVLKDFFKNATNDLHRINDIFKNNSISARARLEDGFKISHGLKGDADLLDLGFIAEKAEELESGMEKMLKGKYINPNDFIPLTIKFSELQNIFEKIEELLNKWAGFRTGISADETTKDETFKNNLGKMVKKLSEKYSKKVRLIVSDFSLDLFSGIQEKPVKDIISQLVKNSIFHGISNVGTIQIKMQTTDTDNIIMFSDDGDGLNLNKIREKAYKTGIINENQFKTLPDTVIPKLIFQNGLSTADSSDVVAGKGVGMSMVNSLVTEMKGSIGIKSKKGVGCLFAIKIPKVLETEGVTV